MSAVHLDLTWDIKDELESFAVPFTRSATPSPVRELGRGKNPGRCPECHSIIYSRRHRLCGVCNQPLPESLLFTPRESQRISQLLHFERVRHRHWLQQHGSKG